MIFIQLKDAGQTIQYDYIIITEDETDGKLYGYESDKSSSSNLERI